jgi:glycosyltransferase involved in cell wall biosynthesis
MRIVIDLQAAQEGDAAALPIALAVAQSAHGHELWVILNGALPGAIRAIRTAFAPFVPRARIVVFDVPAPLGGATARRTAANLLRNQSLAQLAPDRLLVTGLPLAGTDAVVTFDAPVPTALLRPGALVRAASGEVLCALPASGPAILDALLACTASAPAAVAGQARSALLRELAALPGVPLPELAYCLGRLPDPLAPRQLLMDVTAIVQHDLKTGIERVVRTQLMDLLRRAPAGLRVAPVYLSDRGGRWHYRYAHAYAARLRDLPAPDQEDAEVDIQAGDIFYGADYSPHTLAAAAHGGLFDYWRARGVALNFVVYDLLPVLRPDFFPEYAGQTQTAWLRAVSSCADQLVCISAAVAADLAGWLAAEGIDAPVLRALHLGADLDDDAGQPAGAGELPPGLTAAPAFLMVGTLEPRKGHLQAIAAFEQLWAAGVDAHLVIIGHEGWRGMPDAQRRTIPAIVARLQHHPELNRRLFWLRGPSDAVLRQAYADCTCLLVASEGEGFGLPLIEAARYGLPILARALPVFREVAQEHATYFDGLEAADLAAAVQAWLAAREHGAMVASRAMPWRTWRQNVDALLAMLQDDTTAAPGEGL